MRLSTRRFFPSLPGTQTADGALRLRAETE